MTESPKLNFVTYFSKEFLIQGTVAIESFIKSHGEASGLVVCLDSASRIYLQSKNYPTRIRVIEISELNNIHGIFNSFLQTRSYAESIISIKPHLIEFYLDQLESEDYIIYFDADIFFFSSMLSLEQFSNGFEVLLSEHLFPRIMAESAKFGKYNGGMIVFRKTVKSRQLLSRWKNQCTDWCKLELSEGRFADQKYLDDLPEFAGVAVLRNPGVNNGQYYFKEKRRFRISRNEQGVVINGFPILSFHFHGIRVHKSHISTGFNRYGTPRNFLWVLIFIYSRYLMRVRQESFYIRKKFPSTWIQATKGDSSKFEIHNYLQVLKFTRIPHKWSGKEEGLNFVQ